jgi:zinc protease
VHTIDASSWNPGSGGLFCVGFTADAAKREPATAAIRRSLTRCAARGFTVAQIRKAVRQHVVEEINTRKTMSGQAARLGAAEVVAGDLDFSRAYFARLATVMPSELRRALKTYLVPERLTTVSINPAAAAVTAQKRAIRPSARPDFSEFRLPNGARLLLQPDHRLPNLHLRLLFNGGPLFEMPDRRGAIGLLATMLTKDTRQRSAADVAEFIEEVGGSFHPVSGNNCFGLAAEVLPTDAGRALTVLAQAAGSPAFRAKTFALERDAQFAGLREDADDVVTLARKLLRKKFFGTYPLALDPQGDEAGVQSLRPTDLVALYRRLVVAPNAVLAVAGDFDPRRLAPRLKALLAKLPRGPMPRTSARFTGAAEVGDFTIRQPREQAVVLQAFPGPRVAAPDFYVGEVADELFSGMASRLFERVREEKGLAYFVRSSRINGADAGMFSFFAGTQPGREAEVLAEIDAEIARVQAGAVEPAELSRCQARLKAGLRQSLQTNGARAMQAALNAVLGLPVNDWKNQDARIDAVTIADLAHFAATYFQRAQRIQLIVTP